VANNLLASMANTLTDLKELTPAELEAFLVGLGKERFRAGQLLRWIYPRGVMAFSAMTDLAKGFREELAQRATVSSWVTGQV
jgi:23S rRNA (adenine2503-C2)-methyltransferase